MAKIFKRPTNSFYFTRYIRLLRRFKYVILLKLPGILYYNSVSQYFFLIVYIFSIITITGAKTRFGSELNIWYHTVRTQNGLSPVITIVIYQNIGILGLKNRLDTMKNIDQLT